MNNLSLTQEAAMGGVHMRGDCECWFLDYPRLGQCTVYPPIIGYAGWWVETPTDCRWFDGLAPALDWLCSMAR